ncbi:MAG: sensor histidine kinase [Caryophanon sp.]|nr:sensor histidine kinase [Caryophanon sp.]
MIRLFLREHFMWLCFLIGWQLILNALLLLDIGFRDVSLLYVNSVWGVLVVLMLLLRYVRERNELYKAYHHEKHYVAATRAFYEQELQLMQQQQKEAELRLLEQQDEVLAWVHDMKSPLTALKLVHESITNQTERERAEKEWLRIYLLLDQQLHATRLQNIADDNRLERTDLQTIIIDEIKALRTWCFEKQLAIDFDGTDISVISDAKWVGFIVRQLLTNAVKYSHTNGVITIDVTEQHERVSIVVQDEGIGIAAEDLPRVFKKSYTGTLGHETKAATGMGLYLAKQSAQVLNIELSIASVEGEGTTATMTFTKRNAYIETLRM